MNYVLYFLLISIVGMFLFWLVGNVTYYLQLNGYNHIDNFKTITKKLSVEIVAIYLAPAVISLIINVFLYKSKIMWLFMLAEILAYFALIFIVVSTKTQRKTRLVITKRYLRLYVLSLVVSVGVACYMCYKIVFGFQYLFCLVYFLPVLAVGGICVSAIVLTPIENAIRAFYISSATKKLNSNKKLIKIAITGSYGKTSTKFILKSILSEKYSVVATPNSYNTPMGITRTIREMLSDDNQVFIMEFGATKKGDIKYLCKKFQPNIGIITSVGKAHIKTFKNIENVANTKAELACNLYGKNKLCIFNTDNSYVQKICNTTNISKIECGMSGKDCCAKNIVTTSGGTKFDVYYEGKHYVSISTRLIGIGNIQNILLAIAVAIKLKLSKQQIIDGVSKIGQIRARMEVVPHSSGAIIINDGYNSNPDSSRMAVDNMSLFGKKHKIVLTPGMVELGASQYDENYNFGIYLAKHVDKVFVANATNALAISNGLKKGGMDNKHFVLGANLSDVLKSLSCDDILLIENDLPDNYV